MIILYQMQGWFFFPRFFFLFSSPLFCLPFSAFPIRFAVIICFPSTLSYSFSHALSLRPLLFVFYFIFMSFAFLLHVSNSPSCLFFHFSIEPQTYMYHLLPNIPAGILTLQSSWLCGVFFFQTIFHAMDSYYRKI